jgi:hypothetical protein
MVERIRVSSSGGKRGALGAEDLVYDLVRLDAFYGPLFDVRVRVDERGFHDILGHSSGKALNEELLGF